MVGSEKMVEMRRSSSTKRPLPSPSTMPNRKRSKIISTPLSLSGLAMDDLATKKCVACSSKDVKPMTEEDANALIQRVPGWNLVNENGKWKLHQSWKVKTFAKGMEFLQLVADVAEVEGHHPCLHLVGYNVTIDIWTHAIGGLTENDFILAAKISALNIHNLLKNKQCG